MRVQFGDFTFDAETRELKRGATPVHLSPKAFRFLELLLENRPKALSKPDLQEKIWPNTFVSEENLASLAAEARDAIGEDGRSALFVRTVYGFGYAFSGEASDARQPATPTPPRRHFLAEGKREYELAQGENVVGREVDAAVRIDDSTVSRHHARLLVEGPEVTVEDLDSKNGSFVEGKQLKAPRRLRSGDIVKFGSVVMTFRTISPDASTESARPDAPE
jgi:DNA-binding winged helix-turn-helix (wHTH) protein